MVFLNLLEVNMDWSCSGCGRHYNWTVTECPHCQPCVTVATGGTQPTDNQQADYAISREDIFRLRKREISDEEVQEIKEINEKASKNKFSFLQNGKINLTDSDIERLFDLTLNMSFQKIGDRIIKSLKQGRRT